jgi:hypothetical protein
MKAEETKLNRQWKRRVAHVVVVLLTLAWMTSMQAQTVARPGPGSPGSWQILGTITANFKADHDTIAVSGPFDNFRKIKFKVTNSPVNIDRLIVVYENGEPDKIDVRANIPQGGESRQIDLKGVGQRRIRRIDFWYSSKGLLSGKAKVTVFGMK